jgi:hypothetical protein
MNRKAFTFKSKTAKQTLQEPPGGAHEGATKFRLLLPRRFPYDQDVCGTEFGWNPALTCYMKRTTDTR